MCDSYIQYNYIELTHFRRLQYINHPSAKCFEVELQVKTWKEEWKTRMYFSLKYEDVRKLYKRTLPIDLK